MPPPAVRWHFQTTHHDLWDFDLPSQPLLYDLPDGKGGTTPVLVQTSKQGMIFMLNRETGEPVAKVEERPVPAGNVKGERYSPTQPYSVGMPMIGNQTLTESDMWGATPIDLLLCRIQFKEMRHQGVFTPPVKTVPCSSRLARRHELGQCFAGSKQQPDVCQRYASGPANYMVPRAKVAKDASGIEMGIVPMEGTPFGAMRERFLSPLGIPCQKPPFGTMSAVDLKTGKLVWQVPVGTVEDTGPLGIRMHMPIPIGMPTLGASLATQSGLLFFAGTRDFYLRAFDTANGKEIWKSRLPVGSQSGPMTYVSPKTGKQYIIITPAAPVSHRIAAITSSPTRSQTITDRHKQKGPSGPFLWVTIRLQRRGLLVAKVDHGANRFTFMHQIKGLVNLLQRQAMGNKRIEANFTRHGVFHHARQLTAPFTPPKAEPRHTRPVTSWNGRVLISCPAPATPMITLSPQPLWQHSSAARITFTLPMHSKLKSTPPSVSSTITS